MEAFINFIKEFLYLFKFWYVIAPYERGVLIRLGHFKKVLEPGRHWIQWMGRDKVLVDNVVPGTTALEIQDVHSKDDIPVTITAILLWQITDIKKVFLDVEDADSALTDSATGYITEMIESHDWDEIRRPDFPRSLKPHIQRQAREWGIRVQKVQFSQCTAPKQIRLIQDTE